MYTDKVRQPLTDRIDLVRHNKRSRVKVIFVIFSYQNTSTAKGSNIGDEEGAFFLNRAYSGPTRTMNCL